MFIHTVIQAVLGVGIVLSVILMVRSIDEQIKEHRRIKNLRDNK